MDDLDEGLTGELVALKTAVYPEPPDNDREWAPREWGVFVRVDDTLVSYTGVLFREGTVDGDPVIIGGIGGVATHPAHRGQGHAPLGMTKALEFMLSREADFALLVCRDELVAYYTGLGWRLFEGETHDTQFGETELFTFNRVMVRDLAGTSPVSGTIDLLGPAW
jgi:GNAT superfamily N-acetyltransferase